MTLASLIEWALKNLAWLIVALLAVAIVVYVGYRIFGDGPRQAAATATATGAVSAAGTASAHDAVQAVSGNAASATVVHDTVRIDHETIIKTPGADVAVTPELDAAGRRAVCLLVPSACNPDGK